MQNLEVLEKIGLTKGEIRVYLALIEIGESSSGAIINESKISRSKVYEVLEKLKQKNLISEVIKQNIKYFQAGDPNLILNFIKEKENELKKQEEKFKEILPILIDKQKYKEDKQEIKIFTGFKGIKNFWSWLLDNLNENDEYLAMTFPKEALKNKSIIYMFQDFHKKRAVKKINARILSHEKKNLSKEGMDFSQTELYKFKETKQILPTGVSISKNIVATFSWGKNPKVFVIVSNDVAESYRNFFNSIWKEN